jgi:hypothetical protein
VKSATQSEEDVERRGADLVGVKTVGSLRRIKEEGSINLAARLSERPSFLASSRKESTAGRGGRAHTRDSTSSKALPSLRSASVLTLCESSNPLNRLTNARVSREAVAWDVRGWTLGRLDIVGREEHRGCVLSDGGREGREDGRDDDGRREHRSRCYGTLVGLGRNVTDFAENTFEL